MAAARHTTWRCASCGLGSVLDSEQPQERHAAAAAVERSQRGNRWHARQPTYTAEDIEILEDLSPILHRPGMYTDPVNPNHALVEMIDNAADEGLAGFANNVEVTLLRGRLGRGRGRRPRHPGGHPPEKKGAGGAGDLHHAAFRRQVPQDRQGRGLPHRRRPARRRRLREQRAVEAARSGDQARRRPVPDGVRRQRQGRGEAQESSGRAGAKDTGTRVRFWPDAKYFDSPKIVTAEIAALLRAKAMLLPGVQASPSASRRRARSRPRPGTFRRASRATSERDRGPGAGGERILRRALRRGAVGMRQLRRRRRCDVGGRMDAGRRTGQRELRQHDSDPPRRQSRRRPARRRAYNAIKNFIDLHAMGQRGLKVVPEDVWSRANYVLAVKMLDPQFKGQVKNELISRDGVKLVAQMVRDPFELWLNQHVEEGKRIAELVIRQANRAHARRAEGGAAQSRRAWRCCRESSPTARPTIPTATSCSSSRAILPAARRSRRATRNSRRCCRSRASRRTRGRTTPRRSTRTRRSRRSRSPSASITTSAATTPTCRVCATGASSSWPMRTWTGRTSRCCCSRCSSATSRS